MESKSKGLGKIIWVESMGFLLVLSVIGMLFGLWMFDNGFHSIDIAQNMRYLNAEFELNLIDESLQGTEIDSTEAYCLGIWQQRVGLVLLVFGALVFGMLFTDFMRMAKNGQ